MFFTAEYNINSYTVAFADKDGNVIDDFVLDYGEKVTAEDVPAGYKAEKSWALDDGKVVEFPYTVTEDVIFTATEDANVYNVTFYVDGEVYESYMLENGSEVIVPDAPADKTGYKFATWEPDANGATVDGETWGVDDGYGYRTGTMITNAKGQQQEEVQTPQQIVPARAVPEAGQQPGDEQVAQHPPLAASVATQRDIDVLAEPGRE